MPSKERFQRAPGGARLKRCPLIEISTFRSEQQPRLREMILVKWFSGRLFLTDVARLAQRFRAASNLFASRPQDRQHRSNAEILVMTDEAESEEGDRFPWEDVEAPIWQEPT